MRDTLNGAPSSAFSATVFDSAHTSTAPRTIYTTEVNESDVRMGAFGGRHHQAARRLDAGHEERA